MRPLQIFFVALMLFIAVAGLLWAATGLRAKASASEAWQLTDVSGHLPDLRFDLISDTNKAVTEASCRGFVAVLFFGFTSCPDECPATMTRLTSALRKMGPAADRVRVLFVTVDPATDTTATLHAYMNNFDPQHMIGLRGTDNQIRELAQRYRAAYEPPADKAAPASVTHSSALYIFDTEGKARLLAGPTDTEATLAHDLHQLITGAASR
ncbi:MAG: SCO family protein [Pseudomonadota bacterium]|nr:SCO family protein [Pseudomonadota bacterium]